MWIWLDSTGRVKQYLMHGPAPVVGETDFQIFAYFDGLDLEFFDSATIKFKKPDRMGSTYIDLFMRKTTLPFSPLPGDTVNTYFTPNHPGGYTGFLFDFSDFTDDVDLVRLLDTPGMWKATITCLGAPSKTNVSGLITFTVGPSASDDEDQTVLELDQILQNLVLSTSMLRKNSNAYLKVSPSFAFDADVGNLDPNVYSVGSIVYDLTKKDFYKIIGITIDAETGTASATYDRAYRAVKTCNVYQNMTLEDVYNENEGDLTAFMTADGGYLLAMFRYENGGEDIRFDAMDFATGDRYTGTDSKYALFLPLITSANLSQTPVSVLAANVEGIQRLAEPYDESESYAPGDTVIHEGVFYRCLSATTGPWASGSWGNLTFEWMLGDFAESLLADAKRYTDEHGDKRYVYHNDQGQDTWVIDHNLGKRPSVTIVSDTDGHEIVGEVEYVNDNRLIIRFQSALNGSAYLN